jgi:hypothetical protein
MDLVQDIITYVRRIVKAPNNSDITDNLIIDYVNRFWLMDVDARMQLFDLKTKWQFQCSPGVDQYNMPLYSTQVQPGGQAIAPFPVYQGLIPPVFVNGIQVTMYNERNEFVNTWPNYVQSLNPTAYGNGTNGPYTLQVPFLPNSPNSSPFVTSAAILQGHVDTTGIMAIINAGGPNQDPPQDTGNGTYISTVLPQNVFPAVYFTSTDANGNNIVISDSGQFLASTGNSQTYGVLMQSGSAGKTNSVLPNNPSTPGSPIYTITQNTINYQTGIATNVYFPTVIPQGAPINSQCYYYQLGLPRSVLWWNNTLTLRAPPNTQYLIEVGAYLTPAAFLSSSQAIPFGYMAEYIARGAARKILADTGDMEQFAFYEPLFKEQELLVWKRSQRQWTSERTQTIYSSTGFGNGGQNFGNGLGIN